MTKKEIEMLTNLIEHEIFHLEGIVNAFDTKESNESLRNLKSILKALQKPSSQIDSDLNKHQKDILIDIIKCAKQMAQRVLGEREEIRRIQQDSKTLNKLEKSLYAT